MENNWERRKHAEKQPRAMTDIIENITVNLIESFQGGKVKKETRHS